MNIIFDFDDTLIVSQKDRSVRLIEALEEFGAPVARDRVDEYWGRPFYELVVGLAPAVASQYQAFLVHYSRFLQTSVPVACPGVLNAIPVLSLTYRLFVHSASHSLLVRTDLQTLGILNQFEFVCGSDWHRHPKPDPRSFTILDELLRSEKSFLDETWYVGDTATDVDVARMAGLKFVGAGYTDGARDKFLRLGVPNESIVRDMEELAGILKRGDR
jgi:phosphoglycolate phosphatase